MFNAPRPAQRYVATSATGLGGSFVDENPLASSIYDDGLDPWSAAPSPSPTPMPQTTQANSVFSSVIADATVPPIYNQSFTAVDPGSTGETSVNSLSRVLATSALPAATIDRIVNLVSSRPRVSKLEFFVALALVALAQAGKDVSIEQVAALSSQNTLPEPALDLSRLQTSTSTFSPPVPNYRTTTDQTIRTAATTYNSDDPWNTNPRPVGPALPDGFDSSKGSLVNGAPSSLAGSGLPKDWWKRQESVKRGATVSRRYSEFVFLWECLTRRYPFRLFPSLPPKRIGPDDHFLEQRRRGLARSLSFVINHPIIKEDGLLAVFLTEPAFETWRKHTPISLDEESASKRVDRIEEMSIPSDLEDKLATVRARLNSLIEQWQRICILAERIIKRREAAAVRIPPTFRRSYLPTHFAFPVFSPTLSASTTLSSGHPPSILSESSYIDSVHGSRNGFSDEQGDLARLTNTLRAVVEVNEHCWRGDECELSNGVRLGLERVASHAQRHSEMSEQRTQTLFDTTLEVLKSQRDLYIATRDSSFKRVETNSVRLDGIRAAQKDGWQDEADRMWHELRVVLHNRENTLLTQAVHNFTRGEQDFTESVESMPYE
ncbi:hypothetical protein BD779DRAFT_1610403 [Infundibulicybe gibba]|nr:hypothetical protein BD779DRAFT_1610403 [Infundibulicybe gibba]